jgi:hypothetical protein
MKSSSVLTDDRRLWYVVVVKLFWMELQVCHLAIGGIFTSAVTWFSLFGHAGLSTEG